MKNITHHPNGQSSIAENSPLPEQRKKETRVARRDPAPRPCDADTDRAIEIAARAAGPRVWLLYVLMRDLGLRISEALQGRAGDVLVSSDGRMDLRLDRTKGGRGRIAPVLSVRARRALRRAARDVCGPEVFLLAGRWGDAPWTEAGARKAWYAALAAHGAPRVNPHRLRATFATEIVRRGVDLVTVCRALGWRRLDTAARYVSAEDVRRAVGELGR